MLDFMRPTYSQNGKVGKEIYEIKPKFDTRSSIDLMIRGGDFYAIWDESQKLWSTDEETVINLIDVELDEYAKKFQAEHPTAKVVVQHMWDADSGSIDKWHKYVQKQRRDNYKPLDEKLIFSNTETTKEDYASKKLDYPLEECDISAYDKLMSVLYSPEERHKLEWAIGAVISGDSKEIQKFIVMYGAPKTGKSTVLNIMQKLFDGYYSVFDSKAIGSATNVFALEAFKQNPLVAIQHDGDLSRIEDNTRLNSLVSHEMMIVNEKFKSAYSVKFNSFLIMGTNKPVKITDSKSGIIRRLIDVSPTGEKIPRAEYDKLMKKINFELGGIAYHCLKVYQEDPKIYDDYIPTSMIGASNDFYNFVLAYYDAFKAEDSTTLKIAWERYNKYCDDARVPYRYQQRIFKEELKSYFKEFVERGQPDETGTRPWNVYSGFIADKFESVVMDSTEKPKKKSKATAVETWLALNAAKSLLDDICKNWPAQYAKEDESPIASWDNVTTRLKDLDTSKIHYLFFPDKYKKWIVIDFDLKGPDGEKSLELNLEAASKWPATYAEVSKGGQGLHLHYIYTGDPEKLSRIYDEGIEIKVFNGKSSLRRRVSKCNDIPIATLNSGLPLKDEKKVVNFEGLKNERALRTVIKRSLLKEYPPHATVTSVEFIKKVLDDTYASGVEYDVSDMRPAITTFAGRSSHHAQECMALIPQMKFRSETMPEDSLGYSEDELVFFDCEVFSNLFVVVFKALDKDPVKWINPTPRQIEWLIKRKLVGFNCKKYDNHILYARILGETNEQLYKRSVGLTADDLEDRKPYISAAFNLSYTDIWDFAVNKQGLKKWEIELGIHHQELGLPWNQPVPEELWDKVVEYCVYDVLATEAVFIHLKDEFATREMLAAIADGTPNDSTNKLSGRFIFGNNKHPQSHFMYRNLAEPVFEIPDEMRKFLEENFPEMMAEPHGEAKSILPYFPGYKFDRFKPKRERSTYKGFTVGEGVFVMAVPGMYFNVWSLDSASHHPVSISTEYLLGDYTPKFYDILKARIAIKHGNFDVASKMFDGKMAPYLGPDSDTKALSTALKRVVNSSYGLTAQEERDSYMSLFRDPRNVDNIVAKRGALFMIDLLEAITGQGGKVCHCKTDSQKLVNPNKELIEFVFKFAKRYGYSFEVEHHFEKICLVNDAVYVAKLSGDDEEWIGACKKAEKNGKPKPTRWTATGAQFQVPYVFKTLFSKEPIIFEDCCETKSVTRLSDIYLDMNEGLPEGEHNYTFIGKVGQFTPVIDGVGGGMLVRTKTLADGTVKYDSVTGTKGYKWLESEAVKEMKLDDPLKIVDKSYYISKVDAALESISKYGDAAWFCD